MSSSKSLIKWFWVYPLWNHLLFRINFWANSQFQHLLAV